MHDYVYCVYCLTRPTFPCCDSNTVSASKINLNPLSQRAPFKSKSKPLKSAALKLKTNFNQLQKNGKCFKLLSTSLKNSKQKKKRMPQGLRPQLTTIFNVHLYNVTWRWDTLQVSKQHQNLTILFHSLILTLSIQNY